MRTEPRRPALGGEAEHEARLPGRGDELGAAALPLARGGDELPPNIGVSSHISIRRPDDVDALNKLSV